MEVAHFDALGNLTGLQNWLIPPTPLTTKAAPESNWFADPKPVPRPHPAPSLVKPRHPLQPRKSQLQGNHCLTLQSQLLMWGSGSHLPCLAACPGQMGCSWGRMGTSSFSPPPWKLLSPCPSPFTPSLFGNWNGGRGGDSSKAGKASAHQESLEIMSSFKRQRLSPGLPLPSPL